MDLEVEGVGRVTIPAFVIAVPEGQDILLGMDYLELTNPLID